MSCILHITGVNFDVDAFIAQSKVRPYKIFYKGEARFKTKPDGAKLERSGLSIEVSKADMDDAKGQIKDAINFLSRNRKKLDYISKIKGVQHAILDFGIVQKIDRDKHLMESHLLPNRLLQLAGEVGLSIELTFYAENMQTVLEQRSRESDAQIGDSSKRSR